MMMKNIASSIDLASAWLHSIPSWLIWPKIEYTVHIALPKRPINQFKPVKETKGPKSLLSYNIHTVILEVLEVPRIPDKSWQWNVLRV